MILIIYFERGIYNKKPKITKIDGGFMLRIWRFGLTFRYLKKGYDYEIFIN